jgi:riboflavin kinase/FMN adenylyltransferase
MTLRREVHDEQDAEIPMRVTTSSEGWIAVVGEFDGMHLGHQRLLAAAAEMSRRARRPLVGIVIDDLEKPAFCLPVEQRCTALVAGGVHAAVVLPVAEMTMEGPRVARVIAETVRPSSVVLACRTQQMSTGSPLGGHLTGEGLDVVYVERALTASGLEVSTRGVCDAISDGDFAQAVGMLGRPFELAGVVVYGRGLGHTIGFPTANLGLPGRQMVPPLGVYAGRTVLSDGRTFATAVNVGVRPTVDTDGAVVVEAHLAGFAGDLYGANITVHLYERIRSERRFESIGLLVEQLARDVDAAVGIEARVR